jgi:hypothetical protein
MALGQFLQIALYGPGAISANTQKLAYKEAQYRLGKFLQIAQFLPPLGPLWLWGNFCK